MRKQKIKKRLKIASIPFHPEFIPIIEKVTSGAVKGLRLPKDEQRIEFWSNGKELEISRGQWLVSFTNHKNTQLLVFDDEIHKMIFEDALETPF